MVFLVEILPVCTIMSSHHMYDKVLYFSFVVQSGPSVSSRSIIWGECMSVYLARVFQT